MERWFRIKVIRESFLEKAFESRKHLGEARGRNKCPKERSFWTQSLRRRAHMCDRNMESCRSSLRDYATVTTCNILVDYHYRGLFLTEILSTTSHIFISGPKLKQKFLSGLLEMKKGWWKHAMALEASAHITSTHVSLVKVSQIIRWPCVTSMGQKVQSSIGNGLIWRSSQYFEKMKSVTREEFF